MPVDVSQIDALAAELAKAGSTAQVKAHGVVSKSTGVVKSKAIARAPRGATGILVGSIRGVAPALTGMISSDAPYAQYNEFGTSRMSPNPFMFNSLAEVEPPFHSAFEKLAEVF